MVVLIYIHIEISLDSLHFPSVLTTFFKRFYLFIFRERGREEEREGEKQ